MFPKSLTKSAMNLVSVNTIDQKIDEQRTINGLVVISKTLESLAISQNIMHMIESWKQGKLRKELIRNEQTQTNEDIQRTLSSLPSEIVHEIPSETLAEHSSQITKGSQKRLTMS